MANPAPPGEWGRTYNSPPPGPGGGQLGGGRCGTAGRGDEGQGRGAPAPPAAPPWEWVAYAALDAALPGLGAGAVFTPLPSHAARARGLPHRLITAWSEGPGGGAPPAIGCCTLAGDMSPQQVGSWCPGRKPNLGLFFHNQQVTLVGEGIHFSCNLVVTVAKMGKAHRIDGTPRRALPTPIPSPPGAGPLWLIAPGPLQPPRARSTPLAGGRHPHILRAGRRRRKQEHGRVEGHRVVSGRHTPPPPPPPPGAGACGAAPPSAAAAAAAAAAHASRSAWSGTSSPKSSAVFRCPCAGMS